MRWPRGNGANASESNVVNNSLSLTHKPYVCDETLRDYFAQFIPIASEDDPTTIAKGEADNDVPLIPFENSVSLYDLSAATGDFSEQQQVSDDEKEFIRVPEGARVTEDHFACRVVGESMNRIIPNGSVCLFKKYQGGSRNGLIVLAQHTDRQDAWLPLFGVKLVVVVNRSHYLCDQ